MVLNDLLGLLHTSFMLNVLVPVGTDAFSDLVDEVGRGDSIGSSDASRLVGGLVMFVGFRGG